MSWLWTLDERINLPKEKRSDSGEGDCAAGDENSVLFEESPARLPFVDQCLALFVFLQCRIKVSLFHERLRKKKKPRECEAWCVGTKKPPGGGLMGY